MNPFIGTQDFGNTFPGAALPFGMVQLSPDNGGQAGYDHDNTRIDGFSHTHLSGVGCGALGEVRVMPTTGAVASENPTRFGSHYRHDTETGAARLLRGRPHQVRDPRGADGHHPDGLAPLHVPGHRAGQRAVRRRAREHARLLLVGDGHGRPDRRGLGRDGRLLQLPRPPPRVLLRALRPPVRGDGDLAQHAPHPREPPDGRRAQRLQRRLGHVRHDGEPDGRPGGRDLLRQPGGRAAQPRGGGRRAELRRSRGRGGDEVGVDARAGARRRRAAGPAGRLHDGALPLVPAPERHRRRRRRLPRRRRARPRRDGPHADGQPLAVGHVPLAEPAAGAAGAGRRRATSRSRSWPAPARAAGCPAGRSPGPRRTS